MTEVRLERRDQILLWGLIALGVVLRLAALDARPIHHDESIHIYYSAVFADDPANRYYQYNPVTHGPLLYNMWSFFFEMLGVSVTTARLPMALMGCLFVFLPYLFRAYLSPAVLLLATAFVSLSPTLVYWSRFFRHDILVLCTVLGMVLVLWRAPPRLKPLLFIPLFLLQFCIKENAYVTAAILLGYLLFEFGFVKLARSQIRPLLSYLFSSIRTYRWEALCGLFLGVFLFWYLFTGGFRHFGDSKSQFEFFVGPILDGLYRESLQYWLEQHGKERIAGPFLFHSYNMLWYEFPLVIGFFAYLFDFFRRASAEVKLAGLILVFLLFGAVVAHQHIEVRDVAVWKFFHLKSVPDVVGCIALLVIPVLVTYQHLRDGNRPLAFFGYLFFSHYFTYSYLGEKVPWLGLYVLIPAIIYLTAYLQDRAELREAFSDGSINLSSLFRFLSILFGFLALVFFADTLEWDYDCWALFILFSLFTFCWLAARYLLPKMRAPLFALFFWAIVLFQLRIALIASFAHAGVGKETFSQVHTSQEYHRVINGVREEVLSIKGGEERRALVLGDASWPTHAYLYGVPGFSFNAKKSEWTNFHYLFVNDMPKEEEVLEQFNIVRIPLREWWVPDHDKMGFSEYLRYVWTHEPPNPTGYSYVYYGERK